MAFLLGIDQSTSATKAVLFDGDGNLVHRADLPHEQKLSPEGWISHDPSEIWSNTLWVCRQVVEQSQIQPGEIAGVAVTNQRETALIWDRETGEPVGDAVVWQCGRAQNICDWLAEKGEKIRLCTGLPLSPYFSAAKIAWLLERAPKGKKLCAGTIDSYLVFQMTGGQRFQTDYSNACRTQLLDLHTLEWSREVCGMFGIPVEVLPQLTDSNGDFGMTDLGGVLPNPVPIRGVLGDSHGALFGQGCWEPGMTKATYGTGSSVMMNIGSQPVFSQKGLVSSLAWRMDGIPQYVLEGNINYTGSVIGWLQQLGIIGHPKEAQSMAKAANPKDETYLVPAFSGLGAPYWNSGARAILWGMSRSTGPKEIVRAAEHSIAFQISDIVGVMEEEARVPLRELRVDGGPTRDEYLMQFQSDLLQLPVAVPEREELSVIGAVYAAGIALGIYSKQQLQSMKRAYYNPIMEEKERQKHLSGWKKAIQVVLSKE